KIALLPGSRKQEIKHMLPVFLKAAEKLNVTYAIAASPNIPVSFYEDIIRKANIKSASPAIYSGRMYDLLNSCEFAFVTSGTATLETALMNVPQIVAYKGSFISYSIAKALISLRFISLVNLILDQALVPELIQGDLTVGSLIEEYHITLNNQKQVQDEYTRLRNSLGNIGASDRAAQIIVQEAKH